LPIIPVGNGIGYPVWGAEAVAGTAGEIRVLIVDDYPAVRQALRMLLTAEPDMIVVGEASSGRAALEQVAGLEPDVVLMDLVMPDIDGIAATAALRLSHPGIAVIVLSIHDDWPARARAMEAGAAAFVAKTVPATTLLLAIRRASRH
jgi:DNA-binding NarL/FixJ family response regulator